MEKPCLSKSTNRSQFSVSPNLALGSSFIIPRKESKRSKSAVSYTISQKYQQPIVFLRKSKDLKGPFTVYNIPEIRGALASYRKNATKRKKEVDQLNENIYNELKLEEYFSKKSNWTPGSKFVKTSSFLSAVEIYLPLKQKICTPVSALEVKQKSKSLICLPKLNKS